MNRFILFLFIVFIPFYPAFAQDAAEWDISKSTHFIVYFKNAPDDFIGEVINRSEDYYESITEAIGFTRFDFWLWDDRAKIYVYDTPEDYMKETHQPAWSAGLAVPKQKMISTFVNSAGFFDNILPHEMAHIIFREFVGFENEAIPLWLDEGVSSYQEQLRVSTSDMLLRKALDNNKIIALEDLSGFNLRSSPESASLQLFYAEASSAVGFLINNFGTDKFVEFCRNLRDKKNLTQSLSYVYNFSSIKELEASWIEYLKQ